MLRFSLTLLLLMLLATVPAWAQRAAPDSDYLSWSATRRLTAADFQMKPASTQNLRGSTTVFSYDVHWNIAQLLGKKANDSAQPQMLRTASWINTVNQAEQLRYHQALFDLHEVCARRFRQQARANARRTLLFGKPDPDEPFTTEIKTAQLRQAAYVEETDYGTNLPEQVAWEKQIQAELQSLDNYRASE